MVDDEGGIEIPLTKKQGIVVLVLVVAVAAWRVCEVRTEAPEAVKEPLCEALAVEYAGQALPGIEASLATRDSDRFGQQVADLKAIKDTIEIRSITARGTGDEVYVRAEVFVGGGPPPDGKSVRYFVFSRSSITGWLYQRDAFAIEYYTALF